MALIYINMDQGVPQLAYSGCAHCTSTMGISLCSTGNRGCCSYFPKFFPVELQRMAHSPDGLEVLNSILNHPGVEYHEDHIVVKGEYDALLHQKMEREGLVPDDEYIQDSTVFFRTCPFVRSGLGCTLPARYRCYVCNFFVCREVLENPSCKERLAPYLRERENYVRFLEWENKQLLQALHEKGLSIRNHFQEVISFLAQLPINHYEFPDLEPVEIPEVQHKGT